MKWIFAALLLFSGLVPTACSGDKTDAGALSGANEIVAFSLREFPDAPIEIDHTLHTIQVTLPDDAEVGQVTPLFTLSEGASSRPASGETIDPAATRQIVVTAANGAVSGYTLDIRLRSNRCRLYMVSLPAWYCDAAGDTELTFSLPYGADVRAVELDFRLSEGATVEPDLTQPLDLRQPLEAVVTAADGHTQQRYTLRAEIGAQERAVRGVYVPAPSHTASFLSFEAVKESLDLMAELNFNTLFLCAWAQGMTAFDSEILAAHSSHATAAAGNFYKSYTGGSGDALQDILTEAHARGIRVILWYEYGFMAEWRAAGTGPVSASNPICAVHPEWMGRNSAGGQACYNGTDYYLNSYDEEVQDFLISMMEEALRKYPALDGIQGDDRLPAAPRDSGYDERTVARYRAEKGVDPPANCNDQAWVRWRLDILNAFARSMFARIRAVKADAVVCFAPNKYPWCEQNLMQEWPQWVRDGVAQLMTVQCYVVANYSADVATSREYLRNAGGGDLLNPAMILKNGTTLLPESELVYQLQTNRRTGTCGESQFWFDGLKEPYVQRVFKAFYPGKAIFPLND